MSKHTPGPWTVDGQGRHAMVRGADMAIVSVRHRLRFDVHEANARLIAAAPDLLHALKNLLAVQEGEGGTEYHAGDIARAAIAKATGA